MDKFVIIKYFFICFRYSFIGVCVCVCVGGGGGLKVNNEKTEASALGNSRSLWEGHSDLPNLCNTITILGVYFGYDAKQRDELNFRNTLKSINKTINL